MRFIIDTDKKEIVILKEDKNPGNNASLKKAFKNFKIKTFEEGLEEGLNDMRISQVPPYTTYTPYYGSPSGTNTLTGDLGNLSTEITYTYDIVTDSTKYSP